MLQLQSACLCSGRRTEQDAQNQSNWAALQINAAHTLQNLFCTEQPEGLNVYERENPQRCPHHIRSPCATGNWCDSGRWVLETFYVEIPKPQKPNAQTHPSLKP